MCRRRLCPVSCPRRLPDKPVKPNNLPGPVSDKTSVCGEDGWEDGENSLYSQRLSRYGGQEFSPKPDLISSGYVPYGSYVRDYPPHTGDYPPHTGDYPPHTRDYPPDTGDYPPPPGPNTFPPSDRWTLLNTPDCAPP